MNKSVVAFVAVVASFFVPFFASAQVPTPSAGGPYSGGVNPTISSQSGTSVGVSISSVGSNTSISQSFVCPTLIRTLVRGSRGGDVAGVQNFLIAQKDLAAGNNTGYFGTLTETAVKSFQRRNNIVSSGTPGTTGYGLVGAKTRAAIQRACAGSMAAPTNSYSSPSLGSNSEIDKLLAQIQSLQAQMNQEANKSTGNSSGTTYVQGSYAQTNAPVYSETNYYNQGSYTPTDDQVRPASPPYYGVNYFASGYGNFLTDQFDVSRTRIQNDIGLMQSMGINVVRISVAGFANGLVPWTYNQPRGREYFDTANWELAGNNLAKLIKQFKAARIKVIVDFVSINYFLFAPSATELAIHPVSQACKDGFASGSMGVWWQCRYPNRWDDFVWDYTTWVNGIVWLVENDSEAASNVLYYDPIGELQFSDRTGTDMKAFANIIIANNNIPAGKLGISVLNPESTTPASIALPNLKTLLDAAGKKLSFIDVHCYPGISCAFGSQTVAQWFTDAYTNARRSFPASETKFVVGEWGSNYDGGKGLGQANYDAQVVNWAKSNGDVTALVHWNLYDDNPSYNEYHIGVAPTAGVAQGTRNTYMVLGTMRGDLIDGDFESGISKWFNGGSGSNLKQMPIEAVTGSYYGRMQVTAPGQNWFCTPNFVLANGTHVATGGFIRTALANVTLSTRYFDSNWKLIGQDDITLTQPAAWQWRQIQEQSLSKRATTWTGAPYAAQVCFVLNGPAGTSATNPQYLDLDSITVHDY
ncbi:peptidoglycan-binding protein [Candidatus Kaiserbacteria bacterium]|nr:peptidoglycan-binding protein [Candidatus Kaiserbacteria bacterium]